MPALFDIRTSVRENHLSMEDLASRGVTPASVRAMIDHGEGAWIAEIDDVAAAFAMATRGDRNVFAMFVRPGYEGRGLGRALMAEAEAWLFAHGDDDIWLTTDRDPAIRAHGFYRRLGWRDDGVDAHGEVRYVKRAPARADADAALVVESIDLDAGMTHLDGLAALLVACVDDGASIGFHRPMAHAEAIAFWRASLAGVADGSRILYVARVGARLIGTASLALAALPNSRHRAEVQKLMVLPSWRGRGVGRVLMRTLEAAAREASRTLLVLDTREGDPSQTLYESMGWVEVGRIPDFARDERGRPETTVVYYRILD